MKFVQRAGAVAGAVAWMLAGCGGGEESTGSAAVRETAMALEAEPAAAGLTITGTAATGDALAGATVTAKCAGNGGGTAVVGAKGKFSLKATGQLPCVLEVAAPTTGIKLHGALVKGRTANLTPLTELGLARVAGGSAAALFDSFDAAAQAKLTAKNLSAALQALRDAFEDQVKLGGSDAFTATFAINDAHDRKLDDVMDTLTRARTTLPEVGRALAASGATPETVGTLLQPAAATCRGLRTGRYRVLDLTWTGLNASTLQVDANTLRIMLPYNTTPAALTDLGGCSFSFPDVMGTGQALVAPSGVGMLLQRRAVIGASVIVPEQRVPLSELTGIWNLLAYARPNAASVMAAATGSFSVAANGTVKTIKQCAGLRCDVATGAAPTRLQPHADGGFTLTVAGQTARVFAFKAADGHVAMFMRLGGFTGPANMPVPGGLAVATRQAALPLPVVNEVSRYWDLSLSNTGFPSDASSSEVTVTATDTATGTVTRRRTADARIDTQFLNQPLPGLRYRTANSCTANGAPRNCDGTLTLPLPGTGMAVYAGQGLTNYLGVSIAKP